MRDNSLTEDDKLLKIQLLEEKIKLTEGLPHLYGFKFYKWMRKFFDSKNKTILLVAANQVGKSSVQIRKSIHWATAKELWPTLWETTPRVFLYLYPAKEVATIEFEKKWIPEFLPRGEFKNHPVYGWKAEYRNKNIFACHFNSGVSIMFKTYMTDVANLQTVTAHYVAADEEVPIEVYSEINLRRAATDGHYSMVFTATLGQEMWRRAMEEIGNDIETFKDAYKLHASLYECLKYEDGTPSHWTSERIRRIKNTCSSPNEVKKRVFGRFVMDDSLKYPSFDRKNNVKAPTELDKTWIIYSGVDIGTGGEHGHPAAITFVAVRPDYKYAKVFRGWRGDGIVTTASDIFEKYVQLRGDLRPAGQFYDYASGEFRIITSRCGESFIPADKSVNSGESTLNTLFKNEMLDIEDIPELHPLIIELMSVNNRVAKTKAADDAVDSLRYACAKIPWDWSAIKKGEIIDTGPRIMTEAEARRQVFGLGSFDTSFTDPIYSEIDEVNSLYES